MARGLGDKDSAGLRSEEFHAGPKYKYPRSMHLPWSRTVGEDDKVLRNVEHFVGKEVVASAKLDGENCTMGPDFIHARSLDSRHHPSRDWVKALHGQIRWTIPEGWRVCGENLYAEHSIRYEDLPTYFMVFSVWNEKNNVLSWDEMKEFCDERGLVVVPELYRGIWDEEKIRGLWPYEGLFGEAEPEGYVVRTVEGFNYNDFSRHLGKWVRPKHVQTNQHWMHSQVTPNGKV